MIPIWWTCLLIQHFGVEIHHEITSGLGLSLNLSRSEYLLHLNLKLGKNDTTLLNNLLVAAKILIIKKWKTDNVPPLH